MTCKCGRPHGKGQCIDLVHINRPSCPRCGLLTLRSAKFCPLCGDALEPPPGVPVHIEESRI
jgi:hypothetical protein